MQFCLLCKYCVYYNLCFVSGLTNLMMDCQLLRIGSSVLSQCYLVVWIWAGNPLTALVKYKEAGVKALQGHPFWDHYVLVVVYYFLG